MPMNSIVVRVLTMLKSNVAASPNDIIFPFTARYVRQVFSKAVKAAGLARIRFTVSVTVVI